MRKPVILKRYIQEIGHIMKRKVLVKLGGLSGAAART